MSVPLRNLEAHKNCRAAVCTLKFFKHLGIPRAVLTDWTNAAVATAAVAHGDTFANSSVRAMVETRVQLWQLLQHAAELRRRSDEIQRKVRAFLEEVARLSNRYQWATGHDGRGSERQSDIGQWPTAEAR